MKYKYWTPEGYVETDNESTAKKFSHHYHHAYIQGNLVKSGASGQWYWSYVNANEYPPDVKGLGWNQF